MENKKRQQLGQLAKIAVPILLFVLAHFMPSSPRTPYLYLLFNAFVLALGVESGFLAAIAGLRDEKKPVPLSSTTATETKNLVIVKPRDSQRVVANAHLVSSHGTVQAMPNSPNLKEVDKLADAAFPKNASTTGTKKKIKKCPSRASIFFIGAADAESVEDTTVYEEEEEEERGKLAVDLMSKQELFTKAEEFIGNFYKQLKMQREESWKKLQVQDLYYHNHYKTKA